MMWTLTYRDKFSAHNAFIEARDFDTAKAVGLAYCEREILRYVGIKRAVVADESILGAAVKPIPEAETGRATMIQGLRAKNKKAADGQDPA